MASELAIVVMMAREKRLMTRAERDAYTNLVEAYVDQLGVLPDDDQRLAIAARCSRRTWLKLRPFLAARFEVAEGFWRHARLDRALESREAARAGASPELSAVRRAAANERWRRARADANLHDAKHANASAEQDANASPRLETTERQALALASAKGQSQSLPSQNANEDARASAFASKGRGRKAEQPPEMRLPLVQVVEGGLQRAPPAFADAWAKVTAELRRREGDMRYLHWIAPLEVVSAEEGKVVIACRGRFERDTVVQRYGETIANLVVHAAPAFMAVDFIVAPRGPPKENVA